MTTDSRVMALDPVSPRELLDAARAAAGNPGGCALHEFGAVHMWMTHDTKAAAARVTVHFPASGGLLPQEGEPDNPNPDGYAYAGFCTATASDEDRARREHASLARKLGQWLGSRGIRWAWQFESDPWIHGAVPAANG